MPITLSSDSQELVVLGALESDKAFQIASAAKSLEIKLHHIGQYAVQCMNN